MTGFTVPQGAVPFINSATTTTGTSMSVVLGTNSDTGRTVNLCGISFQSTGATAATTVSLTVQWIDAGGVAHNFQGGANGGVFSYPVGASAGAIQSPITLIFDPPIPSQAGVTGSNSGGLIQVLSSALGAGGTNATLNVWGYLM